MILVQLAHLSPRTPIFGSGTLQHVLVGGGLPDHEVFHDLEEALTFCRGVLLVFSISEAATLLVAGIIDKLRKNNGNAPQSLRGRLAHQRCNVLGCP